MLAKNGTGRSLTRIDRNDQNIIDEVLTKRLLQLSHIWIKLVRRRYDLQEARFYVLGERLIAMISDWKSLKTFPHKKADDSNMIILEIHDLPLKTSLPQEN